MAADQAILREYLLALGFKVNETEHKKFDGQVDKTDKRMFALGKTAVAAATSVVTFATLFARSMERLYYSSRYAGSTAGNIKALEFGAQQVGLKAGGATAAVTSMAAALRANPGLVGLLTGKFGIPVAGRPMDAVLLDLVRVLRQMPPYIGQQFAALFGISPEDLFNLGLGLEKLEKAQELHKEMAKEVGVDLDQAAKMGLEYANMWDTIKAHASLFVDLLGVTLLPYMHELAGTTHDVMNDWAKIVRDIDKKGGGQFWQRLREGFFGRAEGDRVTLSQDAKARLGLPTGDEGAPRLRHQSGDWDMGKLFDDWDSLQRWRRRKTDLAPRVATDPAAVDAVQSELGPAGAGADLASRQARLRALERKYGLPEGLLDRVWNAESGRGRNVDGPMLKDGTHAQGDFQFVPKTAAAYGLSNPYDFNAASEAAARMWAERIAARGGDVRMAAADYNWGAGNVTRYGLGRAPKQTRDYMDTVAGSVSVENNTTIHVHGAESPREAAQAVAEVLETQNSETVRNFIPKVR